MTHLKTTAGLDLVSKWTLVISFDLCHVGYREVPSICISAHQAMTWQISSQIPVKCTTNGVQLKGYGYAECCPECNGICSGDDPHSNISTVWRLWLHDHVLLWLVMLTHIFVSLVCLWQDGSSQCSHHGPCCLTQRLCDASLITSTQRSCHCNAGHQHIHTCEHFAAYICKSDIIPSTVY
jgi:hypothetical protein